MFCSQMLTLSLYKIHIPLIKISGAFGYLASAVLKSTLKYIYSVCLLQCDGKLVQHCQHYKITRYGELHE